MSFKVGIGLSELKDGYEAGEEAIAKALNDLGEDECDFTMVFSTIGYQHEDLIDAVREKTGNAPLSGGRLRESLGKTIRMSPCILVQLWRLSLKEPNFNRLWSKE